MKKWGYREVRPAIFHIPIFRVLQLLQFSIKNCGTTSNTKYSELYKKVLKQKRVHSHVRNGNVARRAPATPKLIKKPENTSARQTGASMREEMQFAF